MHAAALSPSLSITDDTAPQGLRASAVVPAAIGQIVQQHFAELGFEAAQQALQCLSGRAFRHGTGFHIASLLQPVMEENVRFWEVYSPPVLAASIRRGRRAWEAAQMTAYDCLAPRLPDVVTLAPHNGLALVSFMASGEELPAARYMGDILVPQILPPLLNILMESLNVRPEAG